MFRFVLGVPEFDVQEYPPVGSQDLIWLGRHLSVNPEHDPCPTTPTTLPWMEVGNHVLKYP